MIELFDGLGIFPRNIVFQLITFVVFVFLMNKVLYGPLRRTMDDRRQRISGSLKEAEVLKAEAEAEQERFKTDLRDRQEESRLMREESLGRIQEVESQEMQKARDSADRLRADAEREAIQIKSAALDDARDEVADLVIMATSRVLDRSIDDPEQRRLVDSVLLEINGERE